MEISMKERYPTRNLMVMVIHIGILDNKGGIRLMFLFLFFFCELKTKGKFYMKHEGSTYEG